MVIKVFQIQNCFKISFAIVFVCCQMQDISKGLFATFEHSIKSLIVSLVETGFTMPENERKQQFFEALTPMTHAMSSPQRMAILEALIKGPLAVEQLATDTGITIANCSRHLQKLKQANLVKAKKHGKRHFYQLASPQVYQLLERLIEVGVSHSAELRDLLNTIKGEEQEPVEQMDVATLRQQIAQGAVLVLDVRPEAEFQQGHIPGAWSIPLERLPTRLAELPHNQTIVAYCRGSLCTLSDEAVRLLQAYGFQAFNFERGFPEWQSCGFAIEKQHAD